jgi:phosphoserine phosphatase
MALPRILTLIADRTAGSLSAAQIRAAREMVSGGEPRILSEGEAAEIPCPAHSFSQPAIATIRAVFAGKSVDVLFTRARGRRKGLLVADMDSTIVASETLDELAAQAGVGEKVAAITARSMNGELDFAEALRERVALLKGLGTDALDRTLDGTRLTPGARTLVATMRAHNARCVLVSGGFTWFTARIAALCGFDEHHANNLEEADGKLTGTVGEPILGRTAKRDTLRRLAEARGLRLSATLAVGDGANDLDMLAEAGLGIAFHAKPVVREAVDTRIDHADLRALLFAQGYPAEAFVED